MGGERNLYTRLSAIENLEYFADLYGVPYKNRKEKIKELLEIVGLPSNRLKDKVETYSKGMKQRLQIARGLINDPEIIFLDEPTIGLDPIGAREIRNIIKRLKNMKKPLFLRVITCRK
ncbi:ATP-binding cassette domain-containing protein [Dictyoglomus thermophilum]|jgi:ABC-2 type transport system ATP-binding protein|uniref:ATP-binding cassette domain-containing protein n=1 Tax=Dictyoglomus thermophilum TaxID=14 RepID=UPI001CA441C1